MRVQMMKIFIQVIKKQVVKMKNLQWNFVDEWRARKRKENICSATSIRASSLHTIEHSHCSVLWMRLEINK